MIDISARLRQILIFMLKTDQYISVKVLAEKLDVSKRTIQRELEYIDSVLSGYQLKFHPKTGVGVRIEGAEAEKERMLCDLKQDSGYDASNKQERRKKLILEILKEKGLRKLFYYSSLLGVSEATVSTDLEAIEDWLREYDLHIIRKPGSGVEIEGSEEGYRKAIRLFVEENIDSGMIKSLYDHEAAGRESLHSIQQSNLSHILNDEILKRVVDSLLRINDKGILSLTESSYIGLVLHVSIAINRILQEEILEEEQSWMKQIEADEEFLLAKKIVQELEKEFSIKIPEIEVVYICLHIKGSKHQNIEWDQKKITEIENREMLELVNEMVNAFDEESAFALKQDDEFIQGLLAHLQPTFIRLMHHMKIQNPVLAEIKKEYKEIFEKCIRVAQVLEQWTGQRIPEEEIGYLAIHFGAAVFRLEGKKENIRMVSVGIVCASGIGISRLISSKLEKAFRNRIVLETYGRNDLTPYVKSKTDFFVDSIFIDEENAHMIRVSPLLNKEDMDKISEALYHYERTPQKENKEPKFTLQLEEVNYLANAIKAVIKQLELFQVNSDITFEKLVFTAAKMLSPYQESQEIIMGDIFRREKLGTQVFAEFGFALLHVRTAGVRRPSFTVCIPKDQNIFQDPYFKKIQVALIMLIPEDENRNVNSQMFGFLSSSLIEDYTFLETLKGGEQADIQELLSKHLHRFFYEYLNKLE